MMFGHQYAADHLVRPVMDTIDWDYVRRRYAGESQARLRHVAMACLRINAGWTYEEIGSAFGLSRGRAHHCIQDVVLTIRASTIQTSEIMQRLD